VETTVREWGAAEYVEGDVHHRALAPPGAVVVGPRTRLRRRLEPFVCPGKPLWAGPSNEVEPTAPRKLRNCLGLREEFRKGLARNWPRTSSPIPDGLNVLVPASMAIRTDVQRGSSPSLALPS
jgi:hypothetical protein